MDSAFSSDNWVQSCSDVRSAGKCSEFAAGSYLICCSASKLNEDIQTDFKKSFSIISEYMDFFSCIHRQSVFDWRVSLSGRVGSFVAHGFSFSLLCCCPAERDRLLEGRWAWTQLFGHCRAALDGGVNVNHDRNKRKNDYPEMDLCIYWQFINIVIEKFRFWTSPQTNVGIAIPACHSLCLIKNLLPELFILSSKSINALSHFTSFNIFRLYKLLFSKSVL